jgi:hypothetical protein
MQYKQGQGSGNPAGVPWTKDIMLAMTKLRKLTPKAVDVIGRHLDSKDQRIAQRAAEVVMDRAMGKPVQTQTIIASASDQHADLRTMAVAQRVAILEKAAELERRKLEQDGVVVHEGEQ